MRKNPLPSWMSKSNLADRYLSTSYSSPAPQPQCQQDKSRPRLWHRYLHPSPPSPRHLCLPITEAATTHHTTGALCHQHQCHCLSNSFSDTTSSTLATNLTMTLKISNRNSLLDSQKRKLRFRAGRGFTQGHTSNKGRDGI